ncbi:MAG: phage holin family protein [Oscillospiraceae bacterium]|jgi:hypothetical protein|nr:phage holin family protein [Oscillospiraceae bacterium]
MIDLTTILMGLITILAGAITKFLIPWMQVHTSKAQQEKLKLASEILVYSAERMFDTGEGEQKLKYVQDLLQKQGFTMDMNTIRAAIESAVEQLPQNAQRRLTADEAGDSNYTAETDAAREEQRDA